MLTAILDTDGKVENMVPHTGSGRLGVPPQRLECRWDWKTFERAAEVAEQASAATGREFLPADAGSHTSPRYDVIEAPKVGARVSRGFNGDYYPAGEIVSVSASRRVVRTSTGVVFYRRQQSATWIADGTWAMVPGHRSELNPSF